MIRTSDRKYCEMHSLLRCASVRADYAPPLSNTGGKEKAGNAGKANNHAGFNLFSTVCNVCALH